MVRVELMRKFIGGVVLLVVAICLLRTGASVDAVLGQASKALDWLINLGAELARRTVPAGSKP
jgi:dihydroxyacetone kinase